MKDSRKMGVEKRWGGGGGEAKDGSGRGGAGGEGGRERWVGAGVEGGAAN